MITSDRSKTMPRKLNLDETANPLQMSDNAGFFRGVEIASDEEFQAFIKTLTEMRKSTDYSNQDCDRRMRAKSEMSKIVKVGKMPIKRRAA